LRSNINCVKNNGFYFEIKYYKQAYHKNKQNTNNNIVVSRALVEKFPGKGATEKTPIIAKKITIRPVSTISAPCMKIQVGHGPRLPISRASAEKYPGRRARKKYRK